MDKKSAAQKLKRLRDNITSVIRGKDSLVELCVVALLARGHLLLEDVPGVGKTTLAGTIADSLHGHFQRIQFTSDMLPADILGVTIYDQERHEFEFRPGPIFANVVLADEINRTTPKTQSALLEAMNVSRVTMDGKVHNLPRPFIVLATQNPVEFHGTFPLPKSQMDRFLMRLHIGYPDRESEMQILREQYHGQVEAHVDSVLAAEEVVELQDLAMEVRIDDDILDYIVRIAEATRTGAQFELGCSPRGTLALRRCAQALALVRGRDYVTPDDVKEIAVPVLAHRVQVARTFEVSGFSHNEDEAAIRAVIEDVAVPV